MATITAKIAESLTENPISTVTVNAWDSQNIAATEKVGTALTSADTMTFVVKNYPAVYSIVRQATTASNSFAGFINVHAAGTVTVVADSKTSLVAGAAGTAQYLGVTASSGTVTLTPNATFESSTIFLKRIL